MDTSPSEADHLLKLLFQAERLQHDRVYYLLVAETIFFLAASTVATPDKKHIADVFALSGAVIAIVFGFINVKTYFRILWLMRRLEEIDHTYREYLNFHRFSLVAPLKCPLDCLFKCFITPWKSDEPIAAPRLEDKIPPKLYDTGVLLALWLPIIIIATWIIFAICVRC